MNTAQRLLIGIPLGGVVGFIVELVAGYVILQIFPRPRVSWAPLDFRELCEGLLLLVFGGPIIGLITGGIAGAINRPLVAPITGAVVGVLAAVGVIVYCGSELPFDRFLVYASIGVITGIVTGLIVERAVVKRPINRARLWLRVWFCSFLVLLSAFLLTTGDPFLRPIGIIGMVLFAVAGIYYQGVDHPWLSRATQTCCELLLREPPKEAHALLCAAHLVEHLSDERAASLIAEQIRSALPESAFYIAHAPVQTYGLTPLHFSPTPTSRWRELFTDEQIDGHLAHLMAMQQPDGGWPITWEAPGPASTSEYRGSWTLAAVSTLVDYGLISEREQEAT